MNIYTADFETTTNPEDCRVWAFAVCDVYNTDFVKYGNSIEDFFKWCMAASNCQLYFHNLGFDGAFIMDYLERNGWKWVESYKDVAYHTYTTLISDMNQLYSITLYFTPHLHCRIYDSLKVIPLSVKQMAKSYGLDEGKGELDYEKYREVGHELTDEEKDYIRRDVQIVAKVLAEFLHEGLTKMTAGSNALYNYKKMLGGHKMFRYIYPLLDKKDDEFLRKAYRGGFTYVNPKFQGKIIGDGIVLDVNSLYPSVMAACDEQILPVGKPTWFDGEYKYDDYFPLWIALVTFRFDIKKDHIPCIQLKGNFNYKPTEYIEHSLTQVTMCVSSVDWKLITMQYDIKNVRWFGGYKFQANKYQFKEYVEKWVAEKNKATIEGNPGKRQIAKLMLNSLYGKFATRMEVCSKKPVLKDDVLHYELLEPSTRDPVYLPVGVFITAYARYKTITSAQSVYDRFVYADTDSLHLVGTELPENLDIDNVKLGAWKLENTFTRAKFLRAKCYIEEIDGKISAHVAGMPANVHDQITFENFELETEYQGKLYQKHVSGGIVLIPGPIKLRS